MSKVGNAGGFASLALVLLVRELESLGESWTEADGRESAPRFQPADCFASGHVANRSSTPCSPTPRNVGDKWGIPGQRQCEPSLLFSPARQQVGANERLQIAVKHSVCISDLCPGTVIFGHAVRLQHIGTYLRSEVDVEFGIFDLLRRGALLFHLELVELRAKHAHGTFAILVL